LKPIFEPIPGSFKVFLKDFADVTSAPLGGERGESLTYGDRRCRGLEFGNPSPPFGEFERKSDVADLNRLGAVFNGAHGRDWSSTSGPFNFFFCGLDSRQHAFNLGWSFHE
jgi:hypothetical protein